MPGRAALVACREEVAAPVLLPIFERVPGSGGARPLEAW
jgi:hypothetical protein